MKSIDTEELIKTTIKDSKSINIANDMLYENNMFLMNSLDVINFSQGINWNYEHPNSANTYKLYIQCLNIISHLTDAYHETSDEIYLMKAYEILLDWIYFITTDEEKNKFKWVDHSVANRVLNIIYFYKSSINNIEVNEEMLLHFLVKHGEFLINDKNYTPNNHGIMVDRSLIVLSIFLKNYHKSDEWFQKAKLRITNAMYRDFSSKGVHLENSPSYHTMTRKMFNNIEKFLKANQMSLGKEVRQRLILTNEYIKFIMKPNHELPIIGDTQKSKIRWIDKSFESFSDDIAGITILQDKKREEQDSTWVSFIAGYNSKTHKHRDDLSITLYHNGEDIFTDSGRYNYDSKDKNRLYLLSSKAHSTLTIKDHDYEIDEPYKARNIVKTTGFMSNDSYDIVKGVNNAFPGISLSRVMLFVKPGLIIIHDQMKSEEAVQTEQIFNLSTQMNVDHKQTNEASLRSEKNNIKIKQLLSVDNLEEFRGDYETPRAVISEEFGKLKENSQLVFSKTGKEVELLTVISLDTDIEKNMKVNFDSQTKFISISGENLDLKINL